MRGIGSRRGFTMIEVLVSTLILGLIGGILWLSFSKSHEHKVFIEKMLSRYQEVRSALNRMVKEFSMAYLTSHKSPLEKDYRTVFKGLRERPIATVHFTSLAHQRLFRDSKESEQCEISYYGRNDKAGLWNIMRRESRRVDEKPLRGGRSEILLNDVLGLELQYWDTKDCTDDCWKDRWDTTQLDGQPHRTPERVKITLTFLDEWGKEMTLMTQAPIMLRQAMRF